MSQKGKTIKAVVYKGGTQIAVEDIPYPTLQLDVPEQKKDCPHGAILKVIASNICGSDLHMVRGKTTARPGLVLGHEITGEVVEVGPHVEFIKVGDLVSVPFNVACGKCSNCKARDTHICLNSNPQQPGGLLGYVDGGGWLGGQAEYVMVPWADFNLLKLEPKEKVMERILDVSTLSDILPTGYHGAVTAGVTTGSTVLIVGAGPVGMACAACCVHLLGASTVIVADLNVARLRHAESLRLKTIDLSKNGVDVKKELEAILGKPEVDCVVDCVGFEAKGHGKCKTKDEPNRVMDTCIEAVRVGGGIGCPGVYLPEVRNIDDEEAKKGKYLLDFGNAWIKGFSLVTGQCPVMRYHKELLQAILADRIPVARYVNATVVPLADAETAYAKFDAGVPMKFILDPHGILAQSQAASH
jgi:glutathione-independent formaldehyde dehydrogenase